MALKSRTNEDFADIKDINYALDQLDGKFYEQESKIDKAVAITGDLAAVEQTVKEMKTQLGTFAQQIKKNTNNLNTTISDVAKLTFQLQLKDLVDSSDMTHVAVDQIDSTDSAVIISEPTPTRRSIYDRTDDFAEKE